MSGDAADRKNIDAILERLKVLEKKFADQENRISINQSLRPRENSRRGFIRYGAGLTGAALLAAILGRQPSRGEAIAFYDNPDQIDFVDQSSLTSPASGYHRLASKAGGIYSRDPSGNEYGPIHNQMPLDVTYVMYNDGSYYYAQNGLTGAIDYGGPNSAGGVSGTSGFDVMQSAINAVIALRGGKIFIKEIPNGGTWQYAGELTATGWTVSSTLAASKYEQLVIEGEGASTCLSQTGSGNNCLILSNGIPIVLRNLCIINASGGKCALYGANTGSDSETSCYYSYLDNVTLYNENASYPACYLINPFWLKTSGQFKCINGAAGTALQLDENSSRGINYGNCQFGAVLAQSNSGSGPAVLLNATGSNTLNLCTFDYLWCGGPSTVSGLKINGYVCNNTFKYVLIENRPSCIDIEGVSSSLNARHNVFLDGLVSAADGGTAITCNQYTSGNEFHLFVAGYGSGYAVTDTIGSGAAPNKYDLYLAGKFTPASLNLANPSRCILRCVTTTTKLPNYGTATITAGNTYVDVPHGTGITPDISQIQTTPQDNLGGRSYWNDTVGSTTFRINISSTDTSEHNFSWRIE